MAPVPSSSLRAAGVCAVAFALVPSLRGFGAPGCSRDCRCLTPEQRWILERMSLVELPDGGGGTVPAVRFTGVNLQVVNGLGATNGRPEDPLSIDPAVTATNGTGNLIVGYNEILGAGDDRTGSHNIVGGAHNDYASFGGLLAGDRNRLRGAYASVAGGQVNAADGDYSTVAGGDSNEALGFNSAIGGGEHNVAAGFTSSVGGGFGNVAAGDFSAVAGGASNVAAGSSATVAGGSLNLAAGDVSSVGGGAGNQAGALYSAVSGGAGRAVDGDSDWRAGTLFEDD